MRKNYFLILILSWISASTYAQDYSDGSKDLGFKFVDQELNASIECRLVVRNDKNSNRFTDAFLNSTRVVELNFKENRDYFLMSVSALPIDSSIKSAYRLLGYFNPQGVNQSMIDQNKKNLVKLFQQADRQSPLEIMDKNEIKVDYAPFIATLALASGTVLLFLLRLAYLEYCQIGEPLEEPQQGV